MNAAEAEAAAAEARASKAEEAMNAAKAEAAAAEARASKAEASEAAALAKKKRRQRRKRSSARTQRVDTRKKREQTFPQEEIDEQLHCLPLTTYHGNSDRYFWWVNMTGGMARTGQELKDFIIAAYCLLTCGKKSTSPPETYVCGIFEEPYNIYLCSESHLKKAEDVKALLIWRLLKKKDKNILDLSCIAAAKGFGKRALEDLQTFVLTEYRLSTVTCVMHAVDEKVDKLYKGWGFAANEGECPLHSNALHPGCKSCPGSAGEGDYPCVYKVFSATDVSRKFLL